MGKNRLFEIINYQESIQPRYNFENHEYFIPLLYPEIKQIYRISNYGRIINNNSGKILTWITRNIQTPWYVYAGLQTETNSRKIIAIHLLVAYSFISKTYEDIMLDRNDINHINCFKNDPRVCNLQWVSREENNRYSILMHENEYIVHKPFNIDKDIKYWGNNYNNTDKNDEIVHKLCLCFEKGLSIDESLLSIGLKINKWNRRWARFIKDRKRRVNISNNYIF